jgi:rubrerythrin
MPRRPASSQPSTPVQRSGAAAGAASTGSKKRPRKSPVTLSDDHLKDMDRKDVQVATAASRSAQFSSWSTPSLFYWGKAHKEWPLPDHRKNHRTAILNELSKHDKYKFPASLAAMQKVWQRLNPGQTEPNWYSKQSKEEQEEEKEQEPPVQRQLQFDDPNAMDEGAGEVEEEEEEEEEEADSAEESEIEDVPRNPKKKAKTVSSAGSSHKKKAQGASDTLGTAACPHCTMASQSQVCPECGMRKDKPFHSDINVFLRRKEENKQALLLRTAGATGHSLHTASTYASEASGASGGQKPSLSRLEQEYERLTAEGSAFTRFEPAKSLDEFSTAKAYAQMRKSFQGTSIVLPPKPSLVKFIQSGKVTYPAWLIPKLVKQQAQNKNEEALFSVFEDGRVTASQQLKAKDLSSMDQLVDVLLCVIFPALIGRPEALMDWVALVHTVRRIASAHGSWSIAQEYLNEVLTAKIEERASFGTFDYSILNNVLSSTRPAADRRGEDAAAAAPSSSRPKATKPGATQSTASRPPSKSEEVCRLFNLGLCKRANCRFTHACSFLEQCGNTDPKHSGKDCSHNPATKGKTLSSTPPSLSIKSEGEKKAGSA